MIYVTPTLPTKFQVNWPFGSGEEAKNRFSRWQPWQPAWISDWNNFSYFWSTHQPDASYQVSSQLALSWKNRFSRWRPAWISDWNNFSYFDLHVTLMLPTKFQVNWPCLGYPIGTIFAIFDLQVTAMLPTKFQVNWPLGSGEAKNRFSRWRPSCISDQNNFSYFLSTSHPDASYQISSQLAYPFRRRSKNRFSRWPPQRPSWISDQNDFCYFLSTSHHNASYQVSSQLAFCFRRRSEK